MNDTLPAWKDHLAEGAPHHIDFKYRSIHSYLDEAAEKYGAVHYLYDGVHPDVAGGKLIAEEWLKVFRKEI